MIPRYVVWPIVPVSTLYDTGTGMGYGTDMAGIQGG